MKGTKYMLIGVACSPRSLSFAGRLSFCRDRLALWGLGWGLGGGGGSEYYQLEIQSAEVLSWAA